jgi:hypothetical protein
MPRRERGALSVSDTVPLSSVSPHRTSLVRSCAMRPPREAHSQDRTGALLLAGVEHRTLDPCGNLSSSRPTVRKCSPSFRTTSTPTYPKKFGRFYIQTWYPKDREQKQKSLAQRRGFYFSREEIAVPSATTVMTSFMSTNDAFIRTNASLVRTNASFMRTNASLMSTNDGFVLTKQTDRAANRYLLATLSTAAKSLKTSHSKKSLKTSQRFPPRTSSGLHARDPGSQLPATCSQLPANLSTLE